jgi:hypothetical protein
MDNLVYHKKKLYKFSEHMDDLTRRASSHFSTEIERTEALTEIGIINNFLEGIFRNENQKNIKTLGAILQTWRATIH